MASRLGMAAVYSQIDKLSRGYTGCIALRAPEKEEGKTDQILSFILSNKVQCSKSTSRQKVHRKERHFIADKTQ